ncbi:MAG: glycosyltransferase family 2 protein [Eubacteriales bacterium]|nr:glycosyltransferase family 2 protein [Eubacteriales bacterium]MDD3074112.1 glycosyltransferase family 2 protein [Eubacteriales bacterium]MDD4078382.1 glycosyltransferase family 2 protein [Eubacteriales bacterium]MDD4768625.1 glycosyltransferase family 2 protein [Eubacteriales bacterium]
MKVAAVIPAYNEEKTIANVVRVLLSSPSIGQVIVVSDGSTDNTAEVAAQLGASVVNLPENLGKGGAMLAGVKNTDADYIMFIDADLIGLRQDHIDNLLAPIKTGEVAATLGVFKKGRVTTDLAQKIAPNLTGQRVIKTSLLELVRDMDISRFGVELALNRLLEEHQIKWAAVELPDLSHVMKEEKLGFWKGFLARLRMYKEIITYFIKY